jgi:hypothetical protein
MYVLPIQRHAYAQYYKPRTFRNKQTLFRRINYVVLTGTRLPTFRKTVVSSSPKLLDCWTVKTYAPVTISLNVGTRRHDVTPQVTNHQQRHFGNIRSRKILPWKQYSKVQLAKPSKSSLVRAIHNQFPRSLTFTKIGVLLRNTIQINYGIFGMCVYVWENVCIWVCVRAC